jgi:bifunctional non-homologous end joining protein LigD
MKYVRIEGSRKLSTFIEPMKAQLSDRTPFNSNDWLFEIKWDGYRAIAEITRTIHKLYSRNGLTFDKAYAKVFQELAAVSLPAILDGEIVVLENGKPNFQRLQNYKNSDKYIIQYHVFDVLEIDGHSTQALTVLQRKELLKQLLPDSEVIKYCDHVENDGKAFFDHLKKLGMEGMIAKRKKSKYFAGKRSADWLKIKNIRTQEAIIVGFTEPKGSRNYFGSLILAVNTAGQLASIGNVGTGFDDQSLKDIHAKLKRIIRKTSPLDTPIKQTPDITWVEPILICNINYVEMTDEGSVRHPVFQGLRIDKEPDQVQLEIPTKKKK